jgi:hypothetical protein
MMYKGKKAVMAKTMADHLRLKKQGYGHDKPKYKDGGKVKEGFEGYEKIASSENSNAIMAKKASHHGKHPKAEYKFTKDKEGKMHMYAKYEDGGKMPNVKPDNRDKLVATYKKGGKVKSRVNEAGNYTKPAMRKRLFQRIKAGTKGGRAGQWSARKAQLLALLYKKNGGGYRN